MGVGRRVPVGAQRNMLGVQNRPTRILLLVEDPWGNFTVFRIKRSTQLKKLMIAYCDKKSVELDNMRFVLIDKGRRVIPNLTPDEDDEEESDEVKGTCGSKRNEEYIMVVAIAVCSEKIRPKPKYGYGVIGKDAS
ncbi:unnamed protein product [Prunus armeniaca]|uniref:Rad60/SUMO-like domain-containing protein n=1 Tax=Prunus armeniaca TaxID=36596 RepID=A0A6J5X413_PRUAR|nr:unnamed protein product [Prunus armeniaca]